MADLSSLTDDVFDMLYGDTGVERPLEDTLSTAVADADDVEWRFVTDTKWKRGDFAEDLAAGEIVVLQEDHPSGADVTVRRAHRGTAIAYSAGDTFLRNPTFPRHKVERFINETVDGELYPHVWMFGQTTVSFVTGTTTYELPADCMDVIAVYQADLDGDGGFHPIHNANWSFVNTVNTSESSTGNYLRLHTVYDPDDTVYVTYKQKPSSSALSSMSDDVAALVPWRVVGKLLAGTRVGPQRVAPGRAAPRAEGASGVKRDAAYFDVEFRRMRKDVQLSLRQRMRDMQKRRRSNNLRRG